MTWSSAVLICIRGRAQCVLALPSAHWSTSADSHYAGVLHQRWPLGCNEALILVDPGQGIACHIVAASFSTALTFFLLWPGMPSSLLSLVYYLLFYWFDVSSSGFSRLKDLDSAFLFGNFSLWWNWYWSKWVAGAYNILSYVALCYRKVSLRGLFVSIQVGLAA